MLSHIFLNFLLALDSPVSLQVHSQVIPEDGGSNDAEEKNLPPILRQVFNNTIVPMMPVAHVHTIDVLLVGVVEYGEIHERLNFAGTDVPDGLLVRGKIHEGGVVFDAEVVAEGVLYLAVHDCDLQRLSQHFIYHV